MTNDKINQNIKPLQEAYDNLLKDIHAVTAELKMLRKNMEADKEAQELTYAFTKDELIGLSIALESCLELLTVTDQITAKISSHLDDDEHKLILKMQMGIKNVYNNFNYYLPSINKFEDWVKERAKQ